MAARRLGNNVFYTIAVLAPFVFIFAVSIDIFVPSIPHVVDYFQTNSSVVQLAVSLFMLVMGLGQLFFGPLSDQIGRRKMVLCAVGLYFVASIICLVASSIWLFILGRVFQALGACGMMAAALAIVRDLYEGDQLARTYSFLNSSISLSPIIIPVIGGYLDVAYGWNAAFYFLSVFSFILFISSSVFVNETLAPVDRISMWSNLLRNYSLILRHRQFQIFAFCGATGLACFFTFLSVSTYIFIKILKYPEQHFGYFFAVNGIMFFLGSLFSGYCAKHIGTYKTALLGAIFMSISGIIMLAYYYFAGLSIYGLMGPMVLMAFAAAMAMGAGAGGAIEPFPDIAGAASALYACNKFVFAFLVSTIIMLRKVESSVPLGLTIFVLGALAALFCFLGRSITQSQ